MSLEETAQTIRHRLVLMGHSCLQQKAFVLGCTATQEVFLSNSWCDVPEAEFS